MAWSNKPWDSFEEEKARTGYLINLGRYGYPCPSDAYCVRYWWEKGRQLGGFDNEVKPPNIIKPLDDKWKKY